MRIPFPCLAAVGLALAMAGPLAAEEITITNDSPHPWRLLWPGDSEDDNIIEPGMTLRRNIEAPGIHRARLVDFREQPFCVLRLTLGEPGGTLLDVLPAEGREDLVRRMVEKVETGVTLHGPLGALRKPGCPPQTHLYRAARLAAGAALAAGRAAAPAAPRVARVLDFDAVAAAPSAPRVDRVRDFYATAPAAPGWNDGLLDFYTESKATPADDEPGMRLASGAAGTPAPAGSTRVPGAGAAAPAAPAGAEP